VNSFVCALSLKCYNYKNRDLRTFLIPLTDNVLSNKSIFGGPYCARNGLDVAALKSGDLEPLERESFTYGLILEIWKQKDSVNQMHQWITALTPLELQRYFSSVTVQNLNKSCNDLMKKGQKLGKNKKKEELELLIFFDFGVSVSLQKCTISNELSEVKEKCEQAKSEAEQLKQHKICLQKKVSHIKKQKSLNHVLKS